MYSQLSNKQPVLIIDFQLSSEKDPLSSNTHMSNNDLLKRRKQLKPHPFICMKNVIKKELEIKKTRSTLIYLF